MIEARLKKIVRGQRALCLMFLIFLLMIVVERFVPDSSLRDYIGAVGLALMPICGVYGVVRLCCELIPNRAIRTLYLIILLSPYVMPLAFRCAGMRILDLTERFYSTVMAGWVLAFLLGPFFLLALSLSATKVLREHGMRVGLMGARKSRLW